MNFYKMHGIGNDFMVVDAITKNIYLYKNIISKLSNRYFGIGFDQLLIVEPPYDPYFDFHYRIFNYNGSEVAQCGNGARCFASFVRRKGFTKKKNILVSTNNTSIIISITDEEKFCVNMGAPNFEPEYSSLRKWKEEKNSFIRIAENTLLFGVIYIGNLHCILQVDDIQTAQVGILGSILESNKRLLNNSNIGFMQIVSSEHIKLRVYERGVGETNACGSGACAAVAIGIKKNFLSEKVHVELTGGNLYINWNGIGYPMYMIGPATHVYEGCIYL